MQLKEVDVIGAQPAQRRLDRTGQVITGRTDIVRPFAGLEGRLRGDEHGIAPAFDGLAEDFLRQTVRVDIGGIEQVEPSLKADVNEAGRFCDVHASPGAKKFAAAAERASAKAECRHFQA